MLYPTRNSKPMKRIEIKQRRSLAGQPAQPIPHLVVRGVGVDGGRQGAVAVGYNDSMTESNDGRSEGGVVDRSAWPVRKYRLGSEPSDDLSASTTAEERLAMMWPLALEAWALTGAPLPDYPRERAPVFWTRSK